MRGGAYVCGGTRIFWGGQRGGPVFLVGQRVGPEFFEGQRGGGSTFFSPFFCAFGAILS